MDVGRDRASGGGPDGDGGSEDGDDGGLDLASAIEDAKSEARGDPEIASFLDGEDDDADSDVDTDSDVDAVFEEFEEGSVEEVMAADEADEEDDELREATDDDVKSLFGDLSTVELEPEADPDGPDGSDPPGGNGEDTTAGATAGASAETAPPRDPEETANEVEGLFDDLSGIDVPEESGPSTGTAETQSTVLDTGADASEAFADAEAEASGFQWLGEDVHIFPADESDVDAVFEEHEAGSVEELIGSAPETPGVGATAMYGDLGAGRLPGAAAGEGAGTAPGWGSGADDGTTASGASDGTAAGVEATELYDDLGDGSAIVESGHAGTDDAAPETDEAAEPGPGTDGAADAEVDATDELALDELDPADELDLELDDAAEPAADEGEADTAPDPAEASGDAESVDAAASADPAPTGTDPTPSEVDPAPAGTDPGDVESVTPDLGAAGVEEPIEGETDVDAIFERFEESTPEEVIAAAEAPEEAESGSVADETVERLFGDLSGVELETAEPSDREEPSAVPEPGSEAAETEVEGLLGDLSGVDVEAESDRGVEPSTGARAETTVRPVAEDPTEDLLERTGADTHVAVGESDVDAIFERFEEGSPEEILDSVEDDARTRDGEGEPAETASVDFEAGDDPATMPGSEDGSDADGDDAADADSGDGGIVSRILGFVSGLFGR